MVNKLIFMDGQKSVDLWEGDEGWTILSGDGNETPARDYYKFIPTMYRAVQLRSNAVASMPFKLTRGETDYDLSSDWENKVGFMPNPGYILQMVEAALVMTGSAYLFRERSVAGTKQLRYHLPGSITPIIDPVRGLEGFKRPVNSVDRKFKVDDYVYFWLPDPYVELGPPINYPAQAAFNAGGVLMNIDVFSASFFKRGAIKAMLLTVQGMPKQADRDKLTDWWKNVVSGVKNAFGAHIAEAEGVKPVVIGEGIKELENVTIGEEKREDIAVALGIPMSILFANAANYATSQQDELNFITKTVIPDCELISGVMNEQLFEPLGLHMTFMPETLDAMQEDEAARSVALGQLTGAGVPLLMAMDLLGFELTEEQRAELEKAILEKEQRAEEMAERLAQKPEPEEETETEDDALGHTPVSQQEGQGDEESEKRLSDMDRWQRKALNALRRGKAASVPFESEHIPTDERQRITLSLAGAKTPDDVHTIFTGGITETSSTPAMGFDHTIMATLVAELRRANDLLIATTPTPPAHQVINIPEQKAATFNFTIPGSPTQDITINVPEQQQPAPIVNVTNTVNPTPVNIRNEVVPTPVNIKNEINPTPVSITNEVSPTPVDVVVNNEVNPTPVNITNEIEIPEPKAKDDIRLRVERGKDGKISRVVEE